ncbi:MAG TPA: FdhF/YdeP family oxidoreductase [Candidatus Acidoferrales bacterium]|nr:FdhF/YdeP family oxidoreductase [Candidatus Acidoferrales bacterium]
MAKQARAGGGLAAVRYTLRKARAAGGIVRLTRRLQSRNACKTCAVGMGGQAGGMHNERGSFPEVCKKSVQAQAADMQPPITESFFAEHPVTSLERWSARELEAAGRLGFPVIWRTGDTHFRRLLWAQALAVAAAALQSAKPERTFFYSSGRSSNEAAFLLQCFARVFGTNNVNNCSYYCHQASGVALQRAIGSGTATVALEDLERADLAIVIGANPASNHPRLMTQLVNLRRRGGKVIVVNPLKEVGLVRFRVPSDWRSLLFGSDVCDLYLQPHIGSDIAVLKLLLKGIIEGDRLDRDYLAGHVENWEAVEADARAASHDALLAACGVPAAEIETAVRLIAASQRTISCWAMGVTQHAHGVDNVQAIVNLALSRGMVGKPGAGLLPIRGHSNVQGVGSVGVSPSLKAEFARRLQELYGIELPRTPGLHTMASVEAAGGGTIDCALLLGGNLFAATPDRTWAGQALRKIGVTVSVTTKLNEGHIHGRGRTCLILPALARDEERQCTTQESMFNFVRLSDGGAPAGSDEMRPEVEIIATLAGMVLPPGPVDFSRLRDHAAIRAAIAAVVPGYAAIGEIDRSKAEFQIAGRTLHAPAFGTASGKAWASVTPVPDFPLAAGEYRLMTLRSEGQFNTVVYEDEDIYRGNERRDVVMMNETDARTLGLRRDQRVQVVNDTGRMAALVRFAPLPRGNLAMYYPEANVLIPRRIDPLSGTPVFKSTAATIVAITD